MGVMRRRPVSKSLRKCSGRWWPTPTRDPGPYRACVATFLSLFGLFFLILVLILILTLMLIMIFLLVALVIVIFILIFIVSSSRVATTLGILILILILVLVVLVVINIIMLIGPVDKVVGVGVGGRWFSSVRGSDSDRGRVHRQAVCELHFCQSRCVVANVPFCYPQCTIPDWSPINSQLGSCPDAAPVLRLYLSRTSNQSKFFSEPSFQGALMACALHLLVIIANLFSKSVLSCDWSIFFFLSKHLKNHSSPRFLDDLQLRK